MCSAGSGKPGAHTAYPATVKTEVSDMRLGSCQYWKKRDIESVRCAKCPIHEGKDAGRFVRAGVLMVLISPLLASEFAEENGEIRGEEMT